MSFAALDQDLRYAWRALSKRRAFNAGIVATIALVIGASTTILTTLDGLLLRQFPFKDADRLVTLWESNRETGIQHLAMSEYAYPVFRQGLSAFSGIGGFVAPTPDLPPWKLADSGERIAQVLATPEMFEVLGASALKGRVFSAADGRPDAPRVAVLGYRFWMTHFGGNTDAIGQEVIINQWGRRVHYVVVGVMPEAFEFPHPLFPDRPDLWTIARYSPPPNTFSRSNAFYVVAKLGKSVTLPQAQADVNRVARQIAMEQPRAYGSQTVQVVPMRSGALHDAKGVVAALLSAFLLITLIGCANIVHLVMAGAGAAGRRRDAAIRIAVGANRIDVFSPAALELGILFAIGGTLGLLVAYWGLKLLPSLLPPQLYIPRADALASQATALLFASGASLVAALALGMALSRGVYRPSVNDELRAVAGPTRSNRSMFRRGGTILLVCQVAFAFALASGALIMVNSLAKFFHSASPIDPERLLAVEVLFAQSVPIDNSRAAYQRFLMNQSATSGIEAIGVVDRYPLGDQTTNSFKVQGAPGPIGTVAQPADVHVVSPSYAHVFGVQLREGRWFADSDGPDGGPVVVVNEAMARHYFPGTSPIGAVLHADQWLLGDREVGWQVIGVVREERRFASEREVPPSVYVPVAQAFMRNVTIVVRTSVPARNVAANVRNHVVSMLPGVSVEKLQTGSDILAVLTARSQFVSRQLTALASLALLLAGVGIYSVVSFRTSRRAHEMAVRMALGSTRRQVVFLVIREALAMVVVGVVAGIPIAIGLGSVLRSLRYDAPPLDVLAYLVATAIFCCAGLAAALPPSLRAAAVDPIETLRGE